MPTNAAPSAAPVPATVADPAAFIARWKNSGAAERANYALFLAELCDLLGVPRPDPTTQNEAANTYVFEKAVTFANGDGTTSPGRIDLYKAGCFVLEAKQGSERPGAPTDPLAAKPARTKRGTAVRGTAGWDDSMIAARGQAEGYAKALPEWPPFLLVADVGHCVELFANFRRDGKGYTPFPDARTHRIGIEQLADDRTRAMLREVWTDPLGLDPTRRSAKVTRALAAKLADLAKSLEATKGNPVAGAPGTAAGHPPEVVAEFLMRCLFTMFAEDVGLLPPGAFTGLLRGLRGKSDQFVRKVGALWRAMNTGGDFMAEGFDAAALLRFNGGLFARADALPLTEPQLDALIAAAEADWSEVEPAIFGTLLERALNPVERHKLGAHYTPRAYVERLVMPTVIEPLRQEWDDAKAAAVTEAKAGDLAAARKTVEGFLERLCAVTVLDPACGTGNFLYVTLEHMKRLEGEARDLLEGFGAAQGVFERFGRTVDPHQFRGIEVNPRAAAIAELVLWIGYLQWHIRTKGVDDPPIPVLQDYRNIERRDAVLAYDGTEPVLDADGKPVTRWDGRTTKKHPVTGEDVPDDTARVPVLRYLNPRKADWPKADFVVGNPPFLGDKRMKDALGVGYVNTLRETHDHIGDSTDYVLYWWDVAAGLTRGGQVRRFGFITTNSLRQTFNRRVLQPHLAAENPISLVFAVPDHPWVDEADGAAVRIAMTTAEAGSTSGTLMTVVAEAGGDEAGANLEFATRTGILQADLTCGAAVAAAGPLLANEGLSCNGMMLSGSGFIVSPERAQQLGLGRIAGLEHHIRRYRNGRDIQQVPRGVMVIDLFGLGSEQVRERFPEVYQHVVENVKPDRDQNNRPSQRNNWWLFGEVRKTLRASLRGLKRYIVTVETSKHRAFSFLDADVTPDHMLISIALEDAAFLGVLSSRIHVVWALAAGGRLGVGNDPRYNKSRCFEPFPFPAATEPQKETIRKLAEELDAHRKARQAAHPKLTLTDMYNVLEKLRSGEALTAKEKATHEAGLVAVLRDLHDRLDAAVADAYGWPADLPDEAILERLVALNKERAAEEAAGKVRWLRPEFQNPAGQGTAAQAAPVVQGTLPIEAADEPDDPDTTGAAPAKGKGKRPTDREAWPARMSEQAAALRAALARRSGPVTVGDLAAGFKGARKDRVEELLETLADLGQARRLDDDRYAAM